MTFHITTNTMKNKIIIGLLILFSFQLSSSQSDSLKFGLKGKIIRALSKSPTDPSVFYAGLKGEKLGAALIYKSEDFGKTWSALNNGNPISPYAADIQAISVANDASNSIYAGTWKDGLFKSTNQGKTWKRLPNVPSTDIRSIKTGVQTPSLVYASTSAFGVIKSIDNGLTWIRSTPEIIDNTFKFAWSIEIDKTNDSIVYAQTYNKGVWKSIDQGNSWTQLLDTKNRVCWDMKISKNSKSVWVVSSKSGDALSTIHFSNNQGETWEELPNVPQIGINQINVLEQNDKHIIYIGSWSDGVFMLKNDEWKKVEAVDFKTISELLLNGDELLIGTWGNGIYNIKI